MTKTLIFLITLLISNSALHVGCAVATPEEAGKRLYPLTSFERMEDPQRDEWQKPEKVIDHLPIKKGDTVADIGSGTGYFAVPLSKRVGKNGVVFAVEIDGEMIKYLEKRAKNEGLENIKNILSRPDDPLLPKSSADLVFLCNTYLFIEKREQYLAKLWDVLKNDGHLAVVSYNMIESIPDAPPVHKRVSREKTIAEAEKAGFVLTKEYFFLTNQYFLLFSKQTKNGKLEKR